MAAKKRVVGKKKVQYRVVRKGTIPYGVFFEMGMNLVRLGDLSGKYATKAEAETAIQKFEKTFGIGGRIAKRIVG